MKHLYRILFALVLCLSLCISCASAEKKAPAPKELSLLCPELAEGDAVQPNVYIDPQNAAGKITYTSSDPAVAYVDEYGKVIGLRAGKAVITAAFSNGVSAECTVNVQARKKDPLKYKLLKDGSGYQITGCAADRSFIRIPAEYKGLPVKSIAKKAFTGCSQIQGFYTDPGQAVFYSEDWVLFTDDPVKTLVRFPNNYRELHTCYMAPADTKAVAPWAFSGLTWFDNIHFQEGLESIGDYAFAEIRSWLSVYLPGTVKKIGKALFQNAQGGAAFYAPDGSYVQQYSWQNDIPFGNENAIPVPENPVSPYVPEKENAEGLPEVDPKGVVKVSAENECLFETEDIIYSADLSARQVKGVSEVRLELRDNWAQIAAGADKLTRNGWSRQTGLYGMGYTEGEAVLRGYDRAGKVTGVRKVSGNFVFSLPKAADLGVAGGTGTQICILPYEPVFIAEPGAYQVKPKKLRYTADGGAHQYWIVMFPDYSVSSSFPNYLNIQSLAERTWKSQSGGDCYTLLATSYSDPYLVSKAGQIWNSFDGLQLLYRDKHLTVSANSGYKLTENYGKRIRDILTGMKKLMKNVLPEGYKVQKIDVAVNGRYPMATGGHIDLDQYVAVDDDSISYTVAHELVHTILVNSDSYKDLVPDAWCEGTAEYFSHKYCKAKNYPYSEYSENFDWSFLTEEDKADIGRYFCESTNRNTEYSLGYYFVDYVVRTYGEEAVRNIETELHRLAEKGVAEEKRTQTFVKVVRNATEKKVFEKFVKKVLN